MMGCKTSPTNQLCHVSMASTWGCQVDEAEAAAMRKAIEERVRTAGYIGYMAWMCLVSSNIGRVSCGCHGYNMIIYNDNN